MLAGSRIIETYGRVSVTLIKMGNPLIPFNTSDNCHGTLTITLRGVYDDGVTSSSGEIAKRSHSEHLDIFH